MGKLLWLRAPLLNLFTAFSLFRSDTKPGRSLKAHLTFVLLVFSMASGPANGAEEVDKFLSADGCAGQVDCQNSTNLFRYHYARAIKGQSDSASQVATCFWTGCDKAVVVNRRTSCAWRAVIVGWGISRENPGTTPADDAEIFKRDCMPIDPLMFREYRTLYSQLRPGDAPTVKSFNDYFKPVLNTVKSIPEISTARAASAKTAPVTTTEQFQRNLRSASKGNYTAQRNVADCLLTGCDGAVTIDKALGCAWRAVILVSGSLQVDAGDRANFDISCRGKLTASEAMTFGAQYETLYRTIYRRTPPPLL